MKIGETLKLIRHSVLKKSQSEIGKEIGVTAQTISNIERNDDPIIIRYLICLRQQNIDINKIIDGRDINDIYLDHTLKNIDAKTEQTPEFEIKIHNVNI